jgi:Sulfotransferase family
MRLPTFLIYGAQRSGTTYLWTLLRSHPDIYLPAPWWPEPKFFSLPQAFAQGPEAYAARFADVGSALAIGEKSVPTWTHPRSLSASPGPCRT